MWNSKLEPLQTTFVSFFSPFDEFYLFGPSADAAFYFVTILSVCKHFEIYYCKLFFLNLFVINGRVMNGGGGR